MARVATKTVTAWWLSFLLTSSLAQTVWQIRASAGSLAGKTKVLISGEGFNREGRDGQTIVYVSAAALPLLMCKRYNILLQLLRC
jgi:hypothetical protein